MQPNLHSIEEGRALCSRMPAVLRQAEDFVQQGTAILPHLEALVINIACQDSMDRVGPDVYLPLVQARLDDTLAHVVSVVWLEICGSTEI